jgi:hypothetical protein
MRFRKATHLKDCDSRISVGVPGDIETDEASEFPHMQKRNWEYCDLYFKHMNSAVTCLFHVRITHFNVARNGKAAASRTAGTNNSGFRCAVD